MSRSKSSPRHWRLSSVLPTTPCWTIACKFANVGDVSVYCLFFIRNCENTLTQQLGHPPENHPTTSMWSVWFFLLIASSLMIVFTGMLVRHFPRAIQLVQSGHASVSSLQGAKRGPLPRSVIYEQADQIWMVSSWEG